MGSVGDGAFFGLRVDFLCAFFVDFFLMVVRGGFWCFAGFFEGVLKRGVAEAWSFDGEMW